MGMERLILLLQNLNPLTPQCPDIYFVSRGKKAENQALIMAQKLRHNDFNVELDLSGSNFGKQFKRGDRSGAKMCLILGDEEVENKTIQIKYLVTGEQKTVSQDELINVLKK